MPDPRTSAGTPGGSADNTDGSASAVKGTRPPSRPERDVIGVTVSSSGINLQVGDLKIPLLTSKRAARAEQTRADLLAAARRVFAEKGYEAASVNDLAAAAGYTKGALYAHFASKEELFLAAVRAGQGDFADNLAAGGQAAAAEMAAHFEALGAAATPEEMPQVMMSLEAYLFGLRHPEARADLAELGLRSLNGMAQGVAVHRALAAGRESGGPPSQDDRDTAIGLACFQLLGSILAQIMPDAGIADAIERLNARLIVPAAPTPTAPAPADPA